jgi:hypothetical protein
VRVIIAGCRNLTDYRVVESAVIASGFKITHVLSGACRGADALGEKWAHDHKIPLTRFHADWYQHGRAAGPIRNREMALQSDALIAIPSENSRGTRDMITVAKKRGLAIYVHELIGR